MVAGALLAASPPGEAWPPVLQAAVAPGLASAASPAAQLSAERRVALIGCPPPEGLSAPDAVSMCLSSIASVASIAAPPASLTSGSVTCYPQLRYNPASRRMATSPTSSGPAQPAEPAAETARESSKANVPQTGPGV